jgi:histidinol-phosphate/aromatic aminotransferase/cobyric acid decarboxylase-like protein
MPRPLSISLARKMKCFDRNFLNSSRAPWRVKSQVRLVSLRSVRLSLGPANSEQVFALPASDGGDPALREALAAFFNHYFHPVHPVQSEHVVLAAGASDAIEHVIHTICEDGDSVLVPGPSWRRSRA